MLEVFGLRVVWRTMGDLLHNQRRIVAVCERDVDVRMEFAGNLPDELVRSSQKSVPSVASQTNSSTRDGECSLAPVPRDPARAKIALTSEKRILHPHKITPFVASLAPWSVNALIGT